jgi:hypothetical protein
MSKKETKCSRSLGDLKAVLDKTLDGIIDGSGDESRAKLIHQNVKEQRGIFQMALQAHKASAPKHLLSAH